MKKYFLYSNQEFVDIARVVEAHRSCCLLFRQKVRVASLFLTKFSSTVITITRNFVFHCRHGQPFLAQASRTTNVCGILRINIDGFLIVVQVPHVDFCSILHFLITLLAWSNSLVNPILYSITSENFRKRAVTTVSFLRYGYRR